MVLGWLTRLTIVLALVGVVGYDAIALGVAQLSTVDAANTAAAAAVDSYRQHPDVTAASAAAQTALPAGDEVVGGSFTVTPAGGVGLKVHKHVETLVVRYLPRVKMWAEVTVDGAATRP